MKTVRNHKHIPSLLINACTIFIIAVTLVVGQAFAEQGKKAVTNSFSTGVLSYQGTLTDAIGNPVTGSYEMRFRIYNSPLGSTALWEELRLGANSVLVNNGLFNMMLGSLVPIPMTAWESPELFLGVQVGSDAEMTPREKLTFVPGANVAQVGLTVPDGSITDQKLGSDVNNYLIQSDKNYSDTYMIPEWTLDEGTGIRDYRTRITFGNVFSTPPSVSVSMSSFDIWSGSNPRLTVQAENVTVDGFDLVYHTWADTIVYGASASWIAYGLK